MIIAFMMAIMYKSSDLGEGSMRVSKEQVAENRRLILESAARLFRERGFDGVTVSDVMKDAGLTHGAFYGHFASKEDLIAQSFAHVLANGSSSKNMTPARYADGYLSPEHRDNRGSGCLFGALGTEAARGTADLRHELTQAMRRQIENFTDTAPGHTKDARRREAVASWSAMVGAIVLARIVDDPALSDEILAETRASLDA
jgi:TetR/AcrR family transcriptional repressor of nem operon